MAGSGLSAPLPRSLAMKVEKDRLKTVTKKVEDGKLFVETVSHNDHVLENNQAHRNTGTITRGQKDNFSIDGAEVIHVIQAPEVDWMFFQRKYPQLYRGLHSKDRVIREASAAEIKRMYPEWFVEVPKKMFTGGGPRRLAKNPEWKTTPKNYLG